MSETEKQPYKLLVLFLIIPLLLLLLLLLIKWIKTAPNGYDGIRAGVLDGKDGLRDKISQLLSTPEPDPVEPGPDGYAAPDKGY